MDQDNQASRYIELAAALKAAIRHEQTVTSRFNDTLAEFLGINRTDARCLELIDLNGKLTAGDLAIHSGLTTGAVTTLVDRLERAGYVERVRDPDDRRKVWIKLSAYAGQLLTRIFIQYGEISALTMQHFSVAELEAIKRFLDVSAVITAERTRLLKAHFVPEPATPEERLLEARAFERDTEIMTRKARRAVEQGMAISPDVFET